MPAAPLALNNDVTLSPGVTWRAKAACRGLDTSVFFPLTDEAAEPAKAICASCPVREECLEYALATRQEDGVWGGLTELERRRLRRRRSERGASGLLMGRVAWWRRGRGKNWLIRCLMNHLRESGAPPSPPPPVRNTPGRNQGWGLHPEATRRWAHRRSTTRDHQQAPSA